MNNKKIISLLMSVISTFAACAMASCDFSTEKTKTEEPTNIVLNDFETFEEDFLTIRPLNNFGKININYDKEYVKFGKASAKIEASSGTFETPKPTMILPTYSTRFSYDYKDFSKTEKVSVWLYNAEEKELSVGLGLQIGKWVSGQWWDRVDRSTPLYYELKSGWNYIEYVVDPTYLAYQGQANIKNIHGLFFEFEYCSQFADVPVIYMDDLRLHLSKTEITGSEYEIKADTQKGVWEIADFEDERQGMFLYMRNYSEGETLRMNARVVNASKYNTTAKSGNNVLELTMHAGSGSGWPRATLSSKALAKVIEKIGQDFVEHPENYQISFDYYNASPVEHSLSVVYENEAMTTTLNPWQNIKCAPYTWSTYTISITKINNTLAGAVESGYLKEGYTADDLKCEKYPVNIVFSGSAFASANDTRDRYYLIDNIRIEKVNG